MVLKFDLNLLDADFEISITVDLIRVIECGFCDIDILFYRGTLI